LWGKRRFKKSLKAIVATAAAIGVGIAGFTEFANRAIDEGGSRRIFRRSPLTPPGIAFNQLK
jgi:hypothetical protein